MKPVVVLISLVVLIFMALPIHSEDLGYRYPDVTEEFTGMSEYPTMLDIDALVEFLEQWDSGLSFEDPVYDTNWVAQSTTLARLESVLRIQDAQLQQVRREGRPVFSIMTDPSNPLYGYNLITRESFPGPTTTIESHKFGLGAGISQQLGSAGSIDLSLSHSISLTSTDGGANAWKQQPSLGITLQQPLFIGDGFIDVSYGRKLLEKQQLQYAGASQTLDRTKQELAVQTMELHHARQALLENRWLLVQQAILSNTALESSKLDLEAGIKGMNEVLREEQSLRELLNSITSIEQEIASLETTIETLSGDEVSFEPNRITDASLQRLLSYADGNLPNDDTTVEQALQADGAYMDAQRALQISRLDRSLGNPADAPRLSISMQASPFYTVTAGNTFVDSVEKLFSSSDPVVNVAVTFMATDLSRSLGRTTKALADEQIVQATLDSSSAQEAVMDRFDQFQRDVDEGVASLSLLMDSYNLALVDVEVAQIRLDAGIIDKTAFRRAELKLYEAAFVMLQKLRALRLLDAQISLFLGL